MRKKPIPGQRSNIALLVSGAWSVAGLLILMIGHVVIIFYAYGLLTNSDALLELQTFLPMLSVTLLYIFAAAAIALDIWMLISQKKAYERQFERE